MLSEVGFGSAPRAGFPGEGAGSLRAYAGWRPIEQATMSYGHGISVSLLQLARAYMMFASDGEMRPVTLLRRDARGRGHARDVGRHRAAGAQHAGTGGAARRHRAAGADRRLPRGGKTGTAHKLDGASYAPDKYVSSFVGLAPASEPRLIVAVMIDEPGAGSTTAARSPRRCSAA